MFFADLSEPLRIEGGFRQSIQNYGRKAMWHDNPNWQTTLLFVLALAVRDLREVTLLLLGRPWRVAKMLFARSISGCNYSAGSEMWHSNQS